MATNPNPPAPQVSISRPGSIALEFALQVEQIYAALASAALPCSSTDREPSLGGKLLYAGSLDAAARALLVAANIAGAATLTVSSDAEARKLATRDGVVDFLVTSLEEALRILKNEIRKHETVAVCVAAAPQALEADFARQMLERGVKPDLTRRIQTIPPEANQTLLAWSVASTPSQWLPILDALALRCLDSDPSPAAWAARRWLRLAPRYLGRMAQGVRLMRCDEKTAARFCTQVEEQVEGAEIGVAVDLTLSRKEHSESYSFAPPTR
jgi:urocanate hydratase